MFLINFNQWKCACVGINNLAVLELFNVLGSDTLNAENLI